MTNRTYGAKRLVNRILYNWESGHGCGWGNLGSAEIQLDTVGHERTIMGCDSKSSRPVI